MHSVTQHPKHLRNVNNRENRFILFASYFIAIFILTLGVLQLISWRQNTSLLLDATSYQLNTATVGSAYGGFNKQDKSNNLGKYSTENYTSGLLVNYIPFDLNYDVDLDMEVSFDGDMSGEGLAIAFRPASERIDAWEIGKYPQQGFGLAGFTDLIGFKIDFHPTSEEELSQVKCKLMCSKDPQQMNAPFGAFIATGSTAEGKPLLSQPRYLQVLTPYDDHATIKDLASIQTDKLQPLSLKWRAKTNTMLVQYNKQQWQYDFSNLVKKEHGYWLVLSSSSGEKKHYDTNVKVNTLHATVAPSAVKYKLLK